MKSFLDKILILIFAFFFLGGLGTFLLYLLNADLFFEILNKRTIERLDAKGSTSQAIRKRNILFLKYLQEGNVHAAYRILDELKDNRKDMMGSDRLLMANFAKLLFRDKGAYEREFKIYDTFLRESDPGMYHYFRAESYKSRGDSFNYKNELLKAKPYQGKSDVGILITSELKKVV